MWRVTKGTNVEGDKGGTHENKRNVILIGDVIEIWMCDNGWNRTDLFETAIDGQTMLASDNAVFNQAHYPAQQQYRDKAQQSIVSLIWFVIVFLLNFLLPDNTVSSMQNSRIVEDGSTTYLHIGTIQSSSLQRDLEGQRVRDNLTSAKNPIRHDCILEPLI